MPAASWRAGLELLGHGRPHGVGLGNRRIIAAREEGRHGLEQVERAPQHADAEGAERFVGREREEVGAEFPHVDRQVRHRLRAVHHQVAAVRMHALGHGADGVLDAEHVRHLGGRDDLRALIFASISASEIVPCSSGYRYTSRAPRGTPVARG